MLLTVTWLPREPVPDLSPVRRRIMKHPRPQSGRYSKWPRGKTLVNSMSPLSQSRAQSFSGSLSAVGPREKLWDDGISLNIC